ncbi:transcriptional regulator [Clostridium butyricum]|uniref:Transcriptional regulator n=1 Tax=Clostridium butyricum TaxID=1492 RepID=A0AAP9UF20_CLOBU|nr:transcriptional regulator [Clostridium butyricum]MBZ5746927.1 transcriptional regulator [Clostridium butyricum]MDI9208026.1 transcriptional regulator [Clostridium butyricum]QGH21770.1 transcriptional regulator [Clostridium butyricum]QGH25809.1 transcriptional regulator [Clostridium butyricum]QMW91811.1 transcriptional regulator [Clostridium butyricum]
MATKKTYLKVEDIMKLTGVSQSKAYKIIQLLNKELKDKGYITIAGQVPTKFFSEKYYY